MKTTDSSYRIETMALIAAAILVAASGAVLARTAAELPVPARPTTVKHDAALEVAASSELQGQICQASIQDQIEWDYNGNRRWQKHNLERICENAKYSLQPGVCFHRVMHGNIDHGSGTRWHWRPALNLCAGTQDASATIKCFSDAIAAQIPWPEAIEQCRANP